MIPINVSQDLGHTAGHHWKSEQKKTTCPYCGVGCGVSVKCDLKLSVNEQGKATQHEVSLSDLKGDTKHQANLGKLCVKGSHLLDTNDLSDRLLHPQVKGKQVPWDEALDSVAQQIQSCLSKYGPESIAFYLSGQLLTEDYYIANKLMKGFLGSANVDTNSRLCMSSAVAAYKRSFGADAVPCCYEDLEQTDLLVITGSNAAWTHPILFQRMQANINGESGTGDKRHMVVIDPRETATSKVADLHLAIKPGSDTWIFNGLLYFLITNKLCDYAYIQQHTNNFEDCESAVNTYNIAAVAQATELSAELIERFYKMFASAHSAITFYSMGINQSNSGVDKANSIINCHLASGKIGKVGSGPFSITGQPNAMGGREVGGLANMLAAHMDIENPQHSDCVERFWQAPNIVKQNGLKAVDMFDAMLDGKIKFVWIMGTNPVVSMPNRLRVEAALEKCDMVVVSDVVKRNDTLAFADIALPAAAWSEKDGTVTNSERCISRQRALMPLPGDAKYDWQIIRDVALKLGFSEAFAYQNSGQIFDEHARLSGFENVCESADFSKTDVKKITPRDFDISGLIGLSQRAFDELEPIQWPVNMANPRGKKRLFEDGQFYTANGKANFVQVEAKSPQQLTSPAYPFVLNTGRMRDQWHTMTRTGKAKALVEHTQQAYVAIHPIDAKAMGLVSGDLSALTSQCNQSKPLIAPVNVTKDVKQGEVFIPIHWSKSNSSHMHLTSLFTSANDPISGQPELKHAAVNIEKVTPKNSASVAIKVGHVKDEVQFSEYQVRINYGDFYLYHLADLANDLNWAGTKTAKFSALPLLERITKMLDAEVTWLGACSPTSQIQTTLGKCEASLVAYVTNDLINPEFINECFEQDILLPEQQHNLLTGTTPDEYQLGRLVCSCFKVRKVSIENAIKEGCSSVQALGDKLQCGTNCGSCKSELASLIKDNEDAIYKQQVPASKELAQDSLLYESSAHRISTSKTTQASLPKIIPSMEVTK